MDVDVVMNICGMIVSLESGDVVTAVGAVDSGALWTGLWWGSRGHIRVSCPKYAWA